MEVLGYIAIGVFILIMLAFLFSYLFFVYTAYRLKNKAEEFMENKAKELITEDNLKKVGTKFQRKLEEAIKKQQESLQKRK